ncbi:hypothetical protein ACSAZK_14920 [Methanosarcina sp. Mfa9]|uniref:hypothetical protein n=1 Tax=Methanosarcina sp. Mfa9 TaxID=3439063 RepID=UPI003F86E5DF
MGLYSLSSAAYPRIKVRLSETKWSETEPRSPEPQLGMESLWVCTRCLPQLIHG